MKNIVIMENDELMVSLEDIAKYSENDYKSVKRLLQNKANDFKEVGLRLPKEYDFKSLLLNEIQATLLIISLRSNKVVDEFRLNLVKQFFAMREIIKTKSLQQLEQKDMLLQKSQKEIKQLKKDRAKYGSLASSDNKYKTLDWIRRNGEYSNSTNWLYLQLENANKIRSEEIIVNTYKPTSSIAITQNNRILFHVDETMKFFDNIKAERGNSFIDTHPVFNF